MVFNLRSRQGQAYRDRIALYDDISYRKYVVAVALDFYDGRHAEYLYWDLLDRNPRGADKYYLHSYPLTSVIINDMALVYREIPVRKIAGGSNVEKNNALMSQIINDTNYDNVWRETEKMVYLTGSPLLTVHWTEADTSKPVAQQFGRGETMPGKSPGIFMRNPNTGPVEAEGVLDVDLVTCDSFDVRVKNSDMAALVYPVTPGSFTGFKGQQIDPTQESVVVYWDEKTHKRVRNKSKSDLTEFDGPNPYGIIPAIAVHRSPPYRYFFQPIDEPLIYMNMNVNVSATQLGFVTRYQTHSQPVQEGGQPFAAYQASVGNQTPVDDLGQANDAIKPQARAVDRGPSQDREIRKSGGLIVAPDQMMDIPEGTEFKYVTPEPHTEELIKTIEAEIRWLAATHGLNPDYYTKMVFSGQPATNMFLSNLKATDNAKQNRMLFAKAEKNLFEIIKRVWNAHHGPGEQFDEDCYLEITYKDYQYPMEPGEKFNNLINKYKEGFLSPIDVIMELEPHLTREEAEERFMKIQEDKEKFQAFSPVDPLVEAQIAKEKAIVGGMNQSVKDKAPVGSRKTKDDENENHKP